MSHLNFNIRAVDGRGRPQPFNPRSKVFRNAASAVWTAIAVMVVAGTTFAIVWFA